MGKASDEPCVAVLASEKEGSKSTLVLLSSLDLETNEVNEMLKEAGLSRLVKISAIKKIEAIPLTGTGKVDYRFLQTMIE